MHMYKTIGRKQNYAHNTRPYPITGRKEEEPNVILAHWRGGEGREGMGGEGEWEGRGGASERERERKKTK